jgi:hypothetical protein
MIRNIVRDGYRAGVARYRKLWWLPAVCLLFCLLLGCGKAQPVGNYTVAVTDRNQRPIADALVAVTFEVKKGEPIDTYAFTDPAGLAHLPTVTVPPDVRAAVASAVHPRYLESSGAIMYVAGDKVEFDTLVLASLHDVQAYRDENPLRRTPESAWAKFAMFFEYLNVYQILRPLHARAALVEEYRAVYGKLQRAYPLPEDNELVRKCRATIDAMAMDTSAVRQ